MGAHMMVFTCPKSEASVEELKRRLDSIPDCVLLAGDICDRHSSVSLPPEYEEASVDEQNRMFVAALRAELLHALRELTDPEMATYDWVTCGGRKYWAVGGNSWGDNVSDLQDYICTLNEIGVTDDYDPRWLPEHDPIRKAGDWAMSAIDYMLDYNGHAGGAWRPDKEHLSFCFGADRGIQVDDEQVLPPGCWRLRIEPQYPRARREPPPDAVDHELVASYEIAPDVVIEVERCWEMLRTDDPEDVVRYDYVVARTGRRLLVSTHMRQKDPIPTKEHVMAYAVGELELKTTKE